VYCIFYFNVIYFLKFIIHKINFKMIKSEMMILIRREKSDVTDTDMIIN
jgi:hypothetical protein